MESNRKNFPGTLGVIQRVLPSYRVPFFDTLAGYCEGGLSLFAGQPRPDEALGAPGILQKARQFPAKNIHIFSTSSPLYLCYQRGIIPWLEETNPDALIIEANFRYVSTQTAMNWMRRRGRPVLGWGLGAPSSRAALDRLRNAFLNRFDALIAYSQRGANQYASCVPGKPVFVAPNAAVPASETPPPARPLTLDRKPMILFVGRLQARKRIPALLMACARIPQELSPRLVIVGDGPEMTSLRVEAERVFPAAEFVGDRRGAELADYFCQADLFVLPGTGGLAVQQAMSFGLAVIVAQGDGTQDDLVREQNGWQIPPGDDQALLHALREALSDIPRLRRMGAESYRIVSEEINLQTMAGVFISALNSSASSYPKQNH